MNDEQIKHMVNRFLGWKLPENFNPDGGISFKKTFNEHTPHPMKHEPSGTNLLDATQAEIMVRYMVEEMPEEALQRRLMETAQELIDRMSSTYTARNGREVGIQGDDGEKCYIVHSDQIHALETALQQHAAKDAGRD